MASIFEHVEPESDPWASIADAVWLHEQPDVPWASIRSSGDSPAKVVAKLRRCAKATQDNHLVEGRYLTKEAVCQMQLPEFLEYVKAKMGAC